MRAPVITPLAITGKRVCDTTHSNVVHVTEGSPPNIAGGGVAQIWV
jgi:hypothetical protein